MRDPRTATTSASFSHISYTRSMASYEVEQQRLRRLLEEDEEVLNDEGEMERKYDEEYDDDASDYSDVEDTVQSIQETHDSESEQDISDTDEAEKPNNPPLSFIGKDKITHWKKHPRQNVKTQNNIKRLRGPTSKTKGRKTPLDIWNYFFNDVIIMTIINCTNEYIVSFAPNCDDTNNSGPTNCTEIRALLGLLYMAGLCKNSRQNTEDLWRADGYGVEIFRLTMCIHRFRFLLRCIRFDRKETRPQRRETDKLAPIREIFDLFVGNCQNGYHLSEFVTIDEMFAGFRGKCSFRQYIPSKPNKYGLKILALCDAKMFYTSKLEVYAGQQPEGPYNLCNKPTDAVLRLCEHILGTGRNVTMDNRFTSVPLCRELQRDHTITATGTIKKNKKELPLQFSRPCDRPERTSMFGFLGECTLVSYIPKKRKNILLVSTLHCNDEIDVDSGSSQKPVIVTDYNKTKVGVESVAKLSASYDCSRNTKRWPMVIFYSMLNIAGINSQVIFCANNPENDLLRRNFLRQLANGLIRPYLEVRANLSNIPRGLKIRLQEICGIQTEVNTVNSVFGRCSYCDRTKNRKTRFSCFICMTHMCLEHITAICRNCQENLLQD